MIRQITGLKQIQQAYDAYLVDAWGVLHDGASLYPGAKDCLERLARLDRPVVILSNAARRASAMRDELDRVGVHAGLYRSVISSGELAWQALKSRSADIELTTRGYYLGPRRSQGICEELGLGWVDSPERAGFVLNAGAPDGNPRNTDQLLSLLAEMAERQLPMICANPDQAAVRGGEIGISAGAIATSYRQLGAQHILYFGKPGKDIFDRALAALAGIDKTRVLMVGDAFETDIAGANAAGIDSLLVTGGIHAKELNPADPDAPGRAAAAYGAFPDYYCSGFCWQGLA